MTGPTPQSKPEPAELARIREFCMALPEATERPSHGEAAFFVAGKRMFVMFANNHHHDGRIAIWCAADKEVQRSLVVAEPEYYFVPPYVGVKGWLGVRLDQGLAWEQVQAIVDEAYLLVAPAKLTVRLRGAREAE